jgi:hypothetical protein
MLITKEKIKSNQISDNVGIFGNFRKSSDEYLEFKLK